MSDAYHTEPYKGHVIGLVNGNQIKQDGKKVWGDYISIDGVKNYGELFTDSARAIKAAKKMIDDMEAVNEITSL